MTTNQQRREAAKRKLERQQQTRRDQAARQRKVAMITAVVVVVVAVGVIVLVTKLGGSSPSTDSAAAAGSCQFTATPDQPAAKPVSLPTVPDPAKTGTVAATLKTDRGDIPLTLDRAKAPCTVESFLNLVNAKFFDNTPCHRLVTSEGLKVLQCGSPTGAGDGGPGYTIPDENPTSLAAAPGSSADQPLSIYPRGAIAMANTGAPNSGGSQFFLVYGDSTLPPNYSVFGTIGEPGLGVIDSVAKAGSDNSNGPGDGKPITSVTIQAATSQ